MRTCCSLVFGKELFVGQGDFAFFSENVPNGTEPTTGRDDRRGDYSAGRAIHRGWTGTMDPCGHGPLSGRAQGAIIGVLGLLEDISKRKLAEGQRKRLATLDDASPDFIGYADPKTTQIKYVNKRGRTMCGIGEDDDIGTPRLRDVHPAWMNRQLAEVALPAAGRDGVWQGDGAFLHRVPCHDATRLYQCVSDPSSRRCVAPGAPSVMASTNASWRSSTVTPSPGRSFGHTLPLRHSRNSGR
jgi:PAS domain-containing protein